MRDYIDHILIGAAFALTLAGYVLLEIHGTDAPRLLDAVIALAGVIGGFAMRGNSQ
jgi:hypothetical protein